MAATFNPSDLDAVAKKLTWFAQELPENERRALAWILRDSSFGGADEVRGYGGDGGPEGRPIVHETPAVPPPPPPSASPLPPAQTPGIPL